MMTLLSCRVPALLTLDYAGTFREERGNCRRRSVRGKEEGDKKRGRGEEEAEGGDLFFGNESGSREREPTAGEIVQLASPH